MAVGLSRLVHLCLAHDNSTGALVPSKTGSSVGKTSLFVDADVPTGTPIAGDYGGQYRPQIHYSPPRNFMNDPNGMFRDGDGTWHLYYQYNPTANVAGNQHWGHATSQDLYHWVNQPIALFPPEENVFIFSGSIVTDPNNTSGFFPDQLNGVVAIYVSRSVGRRWPLVKQATDIASRLLPSIIPMEALAHRLRPSHTLMMGATASSHTKEIP